MDDFHPTPLIDRCLAGDAQAFEPLVRRYQNAAFATALRYVRSRPEAQEIVQDALVAAYCSLGQLRDKRRFGGWLMRIVANRCRDWLRERKRTRPLDGTEAPLADSATQAHADRLQRLELQEAIDQLPEHYRSAVLMYYLSGLSYREIGELMEVPVSTVRGRLQQGRIRLRRLLDEPDQERIDMQTIDVTDQVQEAVCQIATRQVKEVIPLQGTDHIVFACVIDGELEIRQAEGEDALLEGTLSAIGLTPEKAQESVADIEIAADQVDNYLESGPHPCEVFLGTSRPDGEIQAFTKDAVEMWRDYLDKGRFPWGVDYNVRTTDFFPFMGAYAGDMPAEMRAGLEQATRITVFREKIEDVVLPHSAFTDEVRRVFRPNNTSDEGHHGAVGFASLVLRVPEGKRVTVLKGTRVCAYGLRGSLGFIGSTCGEVADIDGDVELFDSELQTARNIRGKLYQRYHQHLGVDWGQWRACRDEKEDCRLEDIRGEVDIDVAGVDIEAAGLAGKVRIYNRYGQTRVRQDQLEDGSRIELGSCAGDIRLALAAGLVERARLTAFTLCGRFEYDAFAGRSVDLVESNNTEAMLLSNAHDREGILAAEFTLKSEVGTIAIDKAE